METKLNADQMEISRQARKFLEKEAPMDYVRQMRQDSRGFTDEIWSKIAELGWLGMLIPEEYGGMGLEQMDMAVILGEMGRSLFPGPFFPSTMLAAPLIQRLGTDEQRSRYLPEIARGQLLATLALQEPESGGDLNHIQMTCEGHKLNGVKLFAPDAHVSDLIIVAVRDNGDNPDGISLFVIDSSRDGLLIERLPTMDETRKLCSITFKDVSVSKTDMLGEPGNGGQELDAVISGAQVGLAAESVAAAERAMEQAVDYAKIRVQFDQPIGSFQAVKHLCARMYEEVESGRSMMYWAAWAQDYASPEEAKIAALSAKVYCSRLFRNVASDSVQVLGGAGFSWEHDIHLFLKRAKANEAMLGDHTFNLESVSAMLTTGFLGV